jgi:predicted O-methyltransferase YrrM
MEQHARRATLSVFNEAWRDITKREGVVTVQNREELEHVFNLLYGLESYLEVGTAEGNSLYVLAHALKPDAVITYIDYGEKHTTLSREEVLRRIPQAVTAIHGDSNDFITHNQVKETRYDAVLIDAGHDAFNVAIDALFYGPLATKYIIFHDVQLPEVNRAFTWYVKQLGKESYRFINSETFGYGIIKL